MDAQDGVKRVPKIARNPCPKFAKCAGKAGQINVGGVNMDETILNNIKTGTQLFTIDQQGYLQGFLAVSILNGYVNYGLSVPTREILTGPGIVDASNVEATMEGVKQGTR